MDLQLLVSAAFRFIATAPISHKDVSLSKYFQFFFYPASIVGPWITFQSFLSASEGSEWNRMNSMLGFTISAVKWIVAVFMQEISDRITLVFCLLGKYFTRIIDFNFNLNTNRKQDIFHQNLV